MRLTGLFRTCTLPHTHALSLSLSLFSHTCTRTQALSLSLSLTHTHHQSYLLMTPPTTVPTCGTEYSSSIWNSVRSCDRRSRSLWDFCGGNTCRNFRMRSRLRPDTQDTVKTGVILEEFYTMLSVLTKQLKALPSFKCKIMPAGFRI